MKKFFTNYRAYNDFLRADGFSPVMNELGNLFLLLLMLSGAKWGGILFIGIPFVVGWAVFQKLEAYIVGGEYMRTGSVHLTKQFIKASYGLK